MTPRKIPGVLTATLVLGLIAPLALRAGGGSGDEDKARAGARRNLMTIALAMHEYHSRNNHFPPAYLRSPEGKPLLSWRVAILPFLGEQALYDAFHTDEPWDSPHNKPLLARMPKVYAAHVPTGTPHATHYKVFVGHGSVFELESDVSLASIGDKP